MFPNWWSERVRFRAQPDRPLNNFRASGSGEQKIVCSSGMLYKGFWSSEMVKGSFGKTAMNYGHCFFFWVQDTSKSQPLDLSCINNSLHSWLVQHWVEYMLYQRVHFLNSSHDVFYSREIEVLSHGLNLFQGLKSVENEHSTLMDWFLSFY